MTKFKALAFLAAGMFAASSAFAGDHCAKTASNEAKAGCDMTFAKLSLSQEQKSKMEQIAADCHKGGCNEATMAKMDREAQKVLSKDQYATWKASHSAKKAEGTRS
jgi:hypothetical protein